MKYDYKGYEPYGAGEAYIVSQWADDYTENATESAIENGCVFHIIDDLNAYLETPAKIRVQYIQKDGPVFPMIETPDGFKVIKEED